MEALKITEPVENPFSKLVINYPLAWNAMNQLCQCSNYKTFNQQNKSSGFNLINLNSKTEDFVEVQSEIDPVINTTLLQILDKISKGQQPFFFSDSFKMITRNPDKLYKILDAVLVSNGLRKIHLEIIKYMR